MPVNNATDLGQIWVIVHHKRDTALTLIFVNRFLTVAQTRFNLNNTDKAKKL